MKTQHKMCMAMAASSSLVLSDCWRTGEILGLAAQGCSLDLCPRLSNQPGQ